jgi:DNA-binding SARP family transcriptional activator
MSSERAQPGSRAARPDPPLRVLGPIELAISGLGSARLRRAAAVFAIHSGTVLSIDRLVAMIWDDDPPANPDAALHTAVSRLRGRLAAAGLTDRLLTRPPGYLLRLTSVDCDALAFTELVDRAVERLADAPHDADAEAATALALWRGPAYAELTDLPEARVERARLAEYRSRAVELRARAALALHRPDRALLLAEQEIATSPLREGPRRLQMLALYRLGRHPEALTAFADLRRTLDEELGLEPSAELVELQQRILRHDPSLDSPAAAPVGPPRDRPAPDRPSVATASPVPAADSGRPAVGPPPAADLPSPRGLVGREAEIGVLGALLASCRVVTVCGPGGVGKTRLATAAAQRAGRPGDVRFIELAAVAPGGSVVHALLTALQLVPTSGVSGIERLAHYIGQSSTLLLLDNCEHLADDVAGVVSRLIDRCSGLTVMTTSQVPLNIPDEQLLPLDPLPVTADGPAPAAAVELFLARPGAATRDSNRTRPIWPPSSTCAGAWTVCRWPSSWPRDGFATTRHRSCSTGCTTVSACCVAGTGWLRTDTGH